jgi:hypothetical protein
MAINFTVITNYVEHPKAIEVVAILSMKFTSNLINTMDQKSFTLLLGYKNVELSWLVKS